MPFEPPQTTDELFGIQRSIFEKLSRVLGHPAISPSKGIGEALAGMVMPPTKEAAASSAMFSVAPAALEPNFRSPEVIAALRKHMAEEMRSRGAITGTSTMKETTLGHELYPTPEWATKVLNNPDLAYSVFNHAPKGMSESDMMTMLLKGERPVSSVPIRGSAPDIDPNPIEQILRGSWYHGMSRSAREAIGASLGDRAAGERLAELSNMGLTSPWTNQERYLDLANRTGFPISLHDSASISNKLGEPAGISLSMLPTKSKQFSADDFIHRVLPLYGGSPSERIVNLMTPEGRKALNDAYDSVMNRSLTI